MSPPHKLFSAITSEILNQEDTEIVAAKIEKICISNNDDDKGNEGCCSTKNIVKLNRNQESLQSNKNQSCCRSGKQSNCNKGYNNLDDKVEIPAVIRRLLDGESDDNKGSFREYGIGEKCGVFGCISNGDWPTSLDVAQIICLGLVGLQHRGQESAGIVTCKYKNESFSIARGEGLVSAAFTEMSMMGLKGNLGVGHTRYSTSGGSGNLQLAQPFVVHTSYGTIAVSHNGELVNSSNLRRSLLSNGVGLSTGGDSELITQCLSQAPPDEFRHPKVRKLRQRNNNNVLHVSKPITNDHSNGNNSDCNLPVGKSRSNSETHSIGGNTNGSYGERLPEWKTDLTVEEDEITSRVLHLMSITPISYSLIIMYNECLYAVRDSFGNRPLTIGMLVPPPNAADIGSIPFSVIDNAFIEGWCISSESCSFPSIHAKLKRDVEPGEIVKFERNKLPKTLAIMPRPPTSPSPAFCIFEYVYFARPDSIVEHQTIYSVRMRCGRRLAIESPSFKEHPTRSEYVVAPVPESSIPAALGFSLESGLPYVEVFCKNRYVGRTFIQPSTRLRRLGVAKKFGPLTENFRGKSVILIDDSIVRGTTIGQLVLLLREAGAKEVHIRIASPPLHFPCYMGINIPTKEELIANHMSPDQLALALGASSLRYLSLEGLQDSVQSGIFDHIKKEKAYLKQRMSINYGPDTPDSDTGVDLTPEEMMNVGHCTACLTGDYPVPLDDF